MKLNSTTTICGLLLFLGFGAAMALVFAGKVGYTDAMTGYLPFATLVGGWGFIKAQDQSKPPPSNQQ